MKYQVPQFIEVEDKIFGPLTLKQFIYVAGGSAIGFILWTVLPKLIAIIIIVPVVGFFFALAFYKYNSRPFILTVESAMKYYLGNKLYIWHKSENKDPKKAAEVKTEQVKMDLPKLSNSKLKELTWSLDINSNISNTENNNPDFKV